MKSSNPKIMARLSYPNLPANDRDAVPHRKTPRRLWLIDEMASCLEVVRIKWWHFRHGVCKEKNGRVLKTLVLLLDTFAYVAAPRTRRGKSLKIRQKLARRMIIRFGHGEVESPPLCRFHSAPGDSSPRLPNLNHGLSFQEYVARMNHDS